MHAHCAVPAAMALMGRKLETESLLMANAQERLRAMDAQGIDVEALSINAGAAALLRPAPARHPHAEQRGALGGRLPLPHRPLALRPLGPGRGTQ